MLMKSKLTLFALVLLSVLGTASCSKESGGDAGGGNGSGGDDPGATSAVHAWELTSWNDNTAIAGYVYLQFGDDGTFTLYQEIGETLAAGYEKLTGTYVIEEYPDSNRIISGRYSDDTPWSDTYIIESWTETEIRWRSVSEGLVSVYTWVELPDYVAEPSVSASSRSASIQLHRFL